MLIYFSGGVLFSLLFAASMSDIQTYRLPDVLTLPLIILGVAFAMSQHLLIDALIGAAIAYAGFIGLELLYKRLRGVDGLGRGDAKLFAAGGAWCGWYALPFIILIASASGLVHALLLSRGTSNQPIRIPFGPHLAIGIFLNWLAIFIFT